MCDLSVRPLVAADVPMLLDMLRELAAHTGQSSAITAQRWSWKSRSICTTSVFSMATGVGSLSVSRADSALTPGPPMLMAGRVCARVPVASRKRCTKRGVARFSRTMAPSRH